MTNYRQGLEERRGFGPGLASTFSTGRRLYLEPKDEIDCIYATIEENIQATKT